MTSDENYLIVFRYKMNIISDELIDSKEVFSENTMIIIEGSF